MSYDKIFVVLIFLGLLMAVQLLIYRKSRKFPETAFKAKNLKVLSKITLSRNVEIYVVAAGNEAFLVGSSKNCSPTIKPLHRDVITEVSEDNEND